MLKSVLFIAKEIYVGANVEALRNNLDIFEASHSAILRGAQWAGIPQLTSMCTIHQMKEVTFYFQRGRGLTRKIFNAQTQAESVLTAARVAKNMSDIVDPLAVAMSEAVKLYVNDPGDCDPLATITDRDSVCQVLSVKARCSNVRAKSRSKPQSPKTALESHRRMPRNSKYLR